MKSMIVLLIACVAGIASAAPGPATTQADGTRYASRDVSLRSTNNELSWDRLIQIINQRSAETAPKILGLRGDDTSDWLGFRPVVSSHAIELSLTVNLARFPSAKPAAKEYVDDLVSTLQDSVRDDFAKAQDQQIVPLKEDEAVAQRDLEQAVKESAELRAKIRKLAGRADISSKTITEAMTKLEEESMQLELDIMAKTARRDALAKEIADQSEKVQQKTAKDAIASELEKVVKARETQVERVKTMAGSGQASPSEVDSAIAQAAEARAKLLERQRDAALEAGGDTIAGLNKELSTLSIDLHELNARLEFVKSRLPGLREATDLLDQWDRVQQTEARAQKSLDGARSDLRSLTRRFSAIRAPQFIVTGSTNRTNAPPPNGSQRLFGGDSAH